mmetsp:Transcript_16237/g.50915  ORF Transcript_16237/g.50915 Transcript_16237/m.50915 type:complete len:188 (-) Transcript_16237:118-681(-)
MARLNLTTALAVLSSVASFSPQAGTGSVWRRASVRRPVKAAEEATRTAEAASSPTAAEFVEKLNLSTIVDEQFDERIKALQETAADLAKRRRSDSDKFLEDLATEVAREERKAVETMESRVGALIEKVSTREKEVERAVEDVRAAQRAVDQFQNDAALFTAASVVAAAGLIAVVVSLAPDFGGSAVI